MIVERFATKCPCWQYNLYQRGLTQNDPNADARYRKFYRLCDDGKIKLMLHSVGCARASADVQADRWNSADNNNAICHAVVDSNDGNTRQTLKWDMRGWHCGGTGNDTHIGVEMCESDQIVYRTDKPWLFSVKNWDAAKKHCETAYNGAVELFAELCKMFSLDPLTDICSHKEGHDKGIASDHGDPEHYWKGLNMPYTMDGFRKDVAKKLSEIRDVPTISPSDDQHGFLGFPDVDQSDWFANALSLAVKHGIIKQSGKPFHPDAPLDKATAIVLFMRLYEKLKRKED